MKTYQLLDRSFEYDDSLEYFDFYLTDRKPNLATVNWDVLLSRLADGTILWDDATVQFVRELSRWVHEAPRKRFYRNMILEGMQVICTEYFFEQEGGDKVIDNLENTGKLAVALCAHYGVAPMEPIKNDDPFNPVSLK
jgi:hypothetical protein